MNPIYKDTLREIRKSFPRFLSIFAIICLGVAFFIGIKATGPSMVKIASDYYEKYDMPDGKIESLQGFNQKDLDLLDSMSEIEWQAISSVYATLETSKQAIKLYSYQPNQKHHYFKLVEGRMPRSKNEIVLDAKYLEILNKEFKQPIKVGSSVEILQDQKDQSFDLINQHYPDSVTNIQVPTLSNEHFTVVGFVEMPIYFERVNRGMNYTSFGVVIEDVVESNIATEVLWWLKGNHFSSYTEEYHRALDQMTQEIEEILLDRPQQKLESSQSVFDNEIHELERDLLKHNYHLLNNYKKIGPEEEQLDAALEEFDNGLVQMAETELNVFQQNDATIKLNGPVENQSESVGSLLEGQSQSNYTRYQLQSAHQAIVQGRKSLREGIQKGVLGIRQGELGVLDLQTAKSELTKVTYEVNDRQNFSSYNTLFDNAKKLNVIANLFPIFFFAIAILVVYSTVKRMAYEQRNYMGTMKQMGYSNRQIISKFMIYAGLACLFGVILGIYLGYKIFPPLIIGAYNLMFYLDEVKVVESNRWNLIVFSISLMCALLPAVYTPIKMLQKAPAHLLTAEPPKQGKKIWLENLTFLWNRLNFNRKMALRNLFRYKGRNLMTLIGVSGCTMLITTGLGISDTISGLVSKQFDSIQSYDATIYLEEDLTAYQLAQILEKVAATFGVKNTIPIYSQKFTSNGINGIENEINLVVPLGSSEDFNKFVSLHTRQEPQRLLSLDQTGPLVTERLAELYHLEQGSQLLLEKDAQEYSLNIDRVIENYVLHYVYMSSSDFNKIFEKKVHGNALLVNYHDKVNVNQLEDTIGDLEHVLTIVNTDTVRSMASQSMDSLGLITLVLIIAAAGLAFIVLYNLTNINIEERIKELATIKVLGFYSKEISLYVYEEIMYITCFASLIGLGLGRILTHLIMKQMQMEDMLFYPRISLRSYGISIVLTLVFSSLVMLLMHGKIRKINMVEALKGVD
ncbi:FtsX-like permease family protein [Facklamia sp. DSM 111018]|uniref:FtsX-like permease family protein n=1 Tax=Facklamia lactis TaxID=2749967 RepID=A0ABS0LRN3_9LACT|nr:ABC transporter permease [Facklamia lactis]MBG9980812.1 FtsX-like permease family protein [Facklamia lactis]MBG9986825.1 FtsX-like permease family protein [Facklamia lactis]